MRHAIYYILYTYIYIYIYMYVYICMYIWIYDIYHWRILWSSHRKLAWLHLHICIFYIYIYIYILYIYIYLYFIYIYIYYEYYSYNISRNFIILLLCPFSKVSHPLSLRTRYATHTAFTKKYTVEESISCAIFFLQLCGWVQKQPFGRAPKGTCYYMMRKALKNSNREVHFLVRAQFTGLQCW